MARKTKITPELIDEICTYIENGNNYEDTLDMVGVATTTFYRWLQEADTGINGNNPKKPATDLKLKRELKEGIKKAEAAFKAFHIQNITKASKKEWQASAWILERRYPKEFAKIDRVVALTSDAPKENGMLGEILDFLQLEKKEDK